MAQWYGDSYTDLIGGQVQMMITGVLALAPHIKSGKLKALAITSAKRSPAMLELPTLALPSLVTGLRCPSLVWRFYASQFT